VRVYVYLGTRVCLTCVCVHIRVCCVCVVYVLSVCQSLLNVYTSLLTSGF